jgi:hypothetical protein
MPKNRTVEGIVAQIAPLRNFTARLRWTLNLISKLIGIIQFTSFVFAQQGLLPGEQQASEGKDD